MQKRFEIIIHSPPEDFQLSDGQLESICVHDDAEPGFVDTATCDFLRTALWMRECREKMQDAGVLLGVHILSEHRRSFSVRGEVSAFAPLRSFLAAEGIGRLIENTLPPASNNRPHPENEALPKLDFSTC